MAPPSSPKLLVQVDRSETKTIKFKNGFPPKIIRSRDSFGEMTEHEPHQRLQLLECEIPLKKGPNVVMQKGERRLHNAQPQTTVNSIPPSGTRRGFIPSFVKHGIPKQGKTRQAPFSPPPTMTELRSLTKKIGRFYTVKNSSVSPSSQPPSRVPSQQRVILDIERALSAKDVAGLEKCYKRIFHGNAEPIRDIVRNQSLPNQRSRQAIHPLELQGSRSATSLPMESTRNIENLIQRRWSSESVAERLPIVPVPYFRNETRSSPARSQRSKPVGDGPVMFSSPRHDYKRKTETPPAIAAVLTLDPDQFPEHTPRSPQLDAMTFSRNGLENGSNRTPRNKKALGYKSSSIWNQRAPNSTPEPRYSNEIHSRSGRHKDLLPQVIPAQLCQNPEPQRLIPERINRQAGDKLSENRFDTSGVSTEPHSYDASIDHRKIKEECITDQRRGLTSGVNSDTQEADDTQIDSVFDEDEKPGDSITESELNENISPDDERGTNGTSDFLTKEAIETGEFLTAQNTSEGKENITNSTLDSIDIENIEIHSTGSSISLTDETVFVGVEDEKIANETEFEPMKSEEHTDLQPEKSEDQYCNTQSEMNELKASTMDNVTVVVVNVTTDEGEDVKADIYEYGCEEKEKCDAGDKFSVEVVVAEEADKENGQAMTRNRKEELEALLKEHSSIVEKIKDLSAVAEES